MIEEWRTILYPLGFLSAIVFGVRFIVQWLQSEQQRKSVAPPLFWHISLAGNLLLALHTFIQFQYHVCIIQACNAVISWRNLNLIQKQKPPLSFRTTVVLIFLAIALTSAAFLLQDFFLFETGGHWFRIPTAPWQLSSPEVSLAWHLLGFLGYILFSSRFWIQWWLAEKVQRSELFPSFWWISLWGAIISSIYFVYISDSVNLVGPLVGIIPYVRNLMLIQKAKQTS